MVDTYRTSIEVNSVCVRELCDMMVDWPWVGVCTSILSARLCGFGVGVFSVADAKELDVSGETEWQKWLGEKIPSFVSSAMAYLACLGFVVYEADTDTGRVKTVDPRELIITMHKSRNFPVQYSIRRFTDPVSAQYAAEGRYRILVLDQPEIQTGVPTGLLVSLRETYRLTVILRRNMCLRDTQNAYTMYGLEAVPGSQELFNHTSADSYRQKDAILGYSLGTDSRADEEEEARERMFLHTGKFLQSMAATKESVKLAAAAGRVAVHDYDPSRIGYFRAPPDTKLVARAACQALPEFVATLLKFEREIFCKFGVPFSIVENHTGNHANVIDEERQALGRAVERYIVPVNQLLDDLSVLFIGADSGVTIRARVGLSEQAVLKLYENGQYTHEAMIEFHRTRYGCSADDFGEDPRPLPPAAAQRQKIEDEEREEARTIAAEKRAHAREDTVAARNVRREDALDAKRKKEEAAAAAHDSSSGDESASPSRKGSKLSDAGTESDEDAKKEAKERRDQKAAEGGHAKQRMNGPGHHGKMTLSASKRREHQKTRDPTSSNKR